MTELNPALVLPLLKWGGIFLVTFGIFIAVRDAVSDVDGLANRYWARYTSTLERKLRPMFIWTPGRVIALAQVGVLAVVSLARPPPAPAAPGPRGFRSFPCGWSPPRPGRSSTSKTSA